METPLSVLLALGLAPWALAAAPAPGAAPPPGPAQEPKTSIQDDADAEPEVIPDFELDGLRQTKAADFGDYAGRLVLIEFFEHW